MFQCLQQQQKTKNIKTEQEIQNCAPLREALDACPNSAYRSGLRTFVSTSGIKNPKGTTVADVLVFFEKNKTTPREEIIKALGEMINDPYKAVARTLFVNLNEDQKKYLEQYFPKIQKRQSSLKKGDIIGSNANLLEAFNALGNKNYWGTMKTIVSASGIKNPNGKTRASTVR